MSEKTIEIPVVTIAVDPAARARELASFLSHAGLETTDGDGCVSVMLPDHADAAEVQVELAFAVAAWAHAAGADATFAPVAAE